MLGRSSSAAIAENPRWNFAAGSHVPILDPGALRPGGDDSCQYGEPVCPIRKKALVIVSFLALERRQSSSEEARERIAGVTDRVLAIRLVHDQLSFKDSASS